MSNQYQLFITTADAPRLVRRRSYDGDDCLEVRDLVTRLTIRVRAQEVSLYRHTLLLEGTEYQILNVTGPSAFRRGSVFIRSSQRGFSPSRR
ncbi:MAG: hypothetical protein NTY05_06410 [Rhodocyclales bacterium]|nr:hypothetical protein [Rhodocyclales bacterium]